MMMFALMGLFSVISILLVKFYTGIGTEQLQNVNENSSPRVIEGAFITQAILSLGIFVVPPLLFSYLTTPQPKKYLGLQRPGKPLHWLFVTLMFIGFLPLSLELAAVAEQFGLSSAAKEAQDKTEHFQNALLKMNSPWDLLKTFTCFAILPALGEEMTFRGVLMRFAAKRSRHILFPILVTAVMFTAMHSNINGIPSIFISGVLLGYIYYLTGSLWCSMLGHMLNNGLQIIITYAIKGNAVATTAMASNSLPAYIVFAGAFLFGLSLWLLIKNRTPLPKNWTNDYAPDEMPENSF
ncbi:MAG: CPBP family intramembrane metalloprotease [Bacteroidetes bacterium]|nr:CPBP family intramembrane metalloprotease [Bacteroidota bacterium]